MGLNTVTKQCIIIGTLTLIVSFVAFACDMLQMERYMRYHPHLQGEFIIRIVMYLIAAVLSTLLIIGIVKRRYLLMLPWLVLCFALAAFSSYYLFMLFAWAPKHSEALLLAVLILGGEIIVLYPICALCHEIRVEENQLVKKHEKFIRV